MNTKIISVLMGFIMQLSAYIYFHYITEHVVDYYSESSVDLGAYSLLLAPSVILTLYSLYLQLFYRHTDTHPISW